MTKGLCIVDIIRTSRDIFLHIVKRMEQGDTR